MLEWPRESTIADGPSQLHTQAGANICLDIHGNPMSADLLVFSDGNHHMALQQSLLQFSESTGVEVCYLTLPPGIYKSLLVHGRLQLGNLQLDLHADILISPSEIFQNLPHLCAHQFARSKAIDLLYDKRRFNSNNLWTGTKKLFISNPHTERLSYQVYQHALQSAAQNRALPAWIIHHGEGIHHREAPQAVAQEQVDAAVVYSHLALRYRRIFPEIFHSAELYRHDHKNCSRYCIAPLNKKPCSQALVEFFLSTTVADIYQQHGLLAQTSMHQEPENIC